MKRRNFLIGLLTLPLITKFDYFADNSKIQSDNIDKNNMSVFRRIIDLAQKENWNRLSIGDCIAKVGLQFVGTPYKAFTLEGEGAEKCRINLGGMDCVTFFEASLCMARIIKKNKYGYEDFVNEIIFTRYRNGKIVDYTSRLHYTSDWIENNIKKGVVKDLTEEIGGEKIKFHLDFMSKHPQFYKPLQENPELIEKIKSIEEKINRRTYYYIPKDKIPEFEKYFKSGDIVAFVTNIKGLDYSHTGLLLRNNNVVRLLDASSVHKKVIIDKPIVEYIQGIKKDKGITVLRSVL